MVFHRLVLELLSRDRRFLSSIPVPGGIFVKAFLLFSLYERIDIFSCKQKGHVRTARGCLALISQLIFIRVSVLSVNPNFSLSKHQDTGSPPGGITQLRLPSGLAPLWGQDLCFCGSKRSFGIFTMKDKPSRMLDWLKSS